MIEQKDWGYKRTLYASPSLDLAVLTVRPRGFCSQHAHVSTVNIFVVLRGTLFVEEGNAEETGRFYTLGCSDSVICRPGFVHRFSAGDEGATILELAYSTDGLLDSEDIERFGRGGIKDG